jgi:hypothetical protein
VQLVQQDLKRNLNITVRISKLDYTGYYGRYVEGKWDGMAWRALPYPLRRFCDLTGTA